MGLNIIGLELNYNNCKSLYIFRTFVGWVEAMRNPTNPVKCWVSFLNPTYTFLFFRQNLRSIAMKLILLDSTTTTANRYIFLAEAAIHLTSHRR